MNKFKVLTVGGHRFRYEGDLAWQFGLQVGSKDLLNRTVVEVIDEDGNVVATYTKVIAVGNVDRDTYIAPLVPDADKMSSEYGYKITLYGEFLPDKRFIALCERLKMYYIQTPVEMDNKKAMFYWKEFNKWCADHGYTREEINEAKKHVRIDK